MGTVGLGNVCNVGGLGALLCEPLAQALVAALFEAAKDELEATVEGLLDEEDHVEVFGHDDFGQHLHFAAFGCTSDGELLYLVADGLS